MTNSSEVTTIRRSRAATTPTATVPSTTTSNDRKITTRRRTPTSMSQYIFWVGVTLVVAVVLWKGGNDDGANTVPAAGVLKSETSAAGAAVSAVKAVQKTTRRTDSEDWCSRIDEARVGLRPSLQIKVPCESMSTASGATSKIKSAVVCMLTDGVADNSQRASRVVFTATNYIHGAMALGASLVERINPEETHMLLLIREGFELAANDKQALSAVGWTIGTVPTVPLDPQYTPRFPRYKTTYTKVAAIGLGEYDCVLLMDADTLAVGDDSTRLQELLTCNLFTQPQHVLGGTLDWFRGSWKFFNTGSILWRPSAAEMERVFSLTTNPNFMKRFSSDQDFLNNVYPERLNNTLNNIIMKEPPTRSRGSPPTDSKMTATTDISNNQVVDMTWDYNAQTHVEVNRPEWWDAHRSTVQILHFTEKKGWQCEERHAPLSTDVNPRKCGKELPDCFCRESHLYWNALKKAKEMGVAAAASKQMQ